jgi:hypothetical protein
MATGRVPTTANSPLTAKGDLFGYSTTQARVAVGNDGETLVADSSTSTGLRYKEDYAAGKNKIINGDFGVWQRGTTFTSPASAAYNADRWLLGFDGNGTATVSRQTFTPGTAPVAGYESQYFYRVACTSVGTTTTFQTQQKIEDVRTFAGQTITISFWAKKDNNKTIGIFTEQFFGSGGSGSVFQTSARITPSTSWARYSVTYTLASIAGKTIGTGSAIVIYFAMDDTLTTSSVLDIWGVQVEESPVATSFQTATGTIQGELAACQRYYWRVTTNSIYGAIGGGISTSTTNAGVLVNHPVSMRVNPTAVDYSTLRLTDFYAIATSVTALTLVANDTTNLISRLSVNVGSGLTQDRPTYLTANNSTSAYIGLSAEL